MTTDQPAQPKPVTWESRTLDVLERAYREYRATGALDLPVLGEMAMVLFQRGRLQPDQPPT